MKYPKDSILVPALTTGFAAVLTTHVMAQTFTNLYTFKGQSDRSYPCAPVIASGNTLYGTTSDAQHGGYGSVFAMNMDGTGFTNLHTFTSTSGPYPSTNSDGAIPRSGLVLSEGVLYGTTSSGGTLGLGTIFAVKIDGTGFTNLHNFAGYPSDGSVPYAGLVLSSNILYGTTTKGGSSLAGSAFAIKTDGSSFRLLHSFSGPDGATPYAELLLTGNVLYGTTREAGTNGYGTVFAINIDDTSFRVMHTFDGVNDGDEPTCALVLSSNILYGTTSGWISTSYGTLFALHTDGTGFTNLYSFRAAEDGRDPWAGLILRGDTLYGTAEFGGTSGYGTLFCIKTDGSGFSILHSFAGGPEDGGDLRARLTLANNTLYGTTYSGGSSWVGTVFSLAIAPTISPQLTLASSGASMILAWPTNAIGFTLQSATNLVLPLAWVPVSPLPVVVNGQNVVTNSISGVQMYYRLSQ
jgi:uncharacterized repeat protein (TIGR03803 family)